MANVFGISFPLIHVFKMSTFFYHLIFESFGGTSLITAYSIHGIFFVVFLNDYMVILWYFYGIFMVFFLVFLYLNIISVDQTD